MKFKKGYKYVLAEAEETRVPIRLQRDIVQPLFSLKDGVLRIEAGYAWDGPSGPTIDTKSFMRSSLVHDCLYQMMRMRLVDISWRQTADMFLYAQCVEDGMWRLRANWVYKGVRIGGGDAARKPRKIYVAP